jgi:hypothetical protein
MRANIERRRWADSCSLALLTPAIGECPLRADSVAKVENRTTSKISQKRALADSATAILRGAETKLRGRFCDAAACTERRRGKRDRNTAYWLGLSEGRAQEAQARYDEATRRSRVLGFHYAETAELANNRPTLEALERRVEKLEKQITALLKK